MRALVLAGVREVVLDPDHPDPRVETPTDAVVRVTQAGLCGSDLHPYEGREAVRFGVVPGHEAVGEVVAVGDEVRRVSIGDRVLVPFTVSCGACPACRSGLTSRCASSALFGWADPGDPAAPPLEGGQAEHVRVPLADGTLVRVPDGVDDATAVLLCDNLPTGWYAAERAEVVPDATVAVIGLGAVGLCAVVAARALGARHVLAVDPVAGRREAAERLGAEPLHPDEVAGDRRVDAAVEAAGPAAAQSLAASLVRPGGTLAIVAVQTAEVFAVPPVLAYDRNLTIRAGRAPVRAVLDRLLPRLADGRLVAPTGEVVTHPDRPLEDGPEAYRRFADREPGMVKVTFRP